MTDEAQTGQEIPVGDLTMEQAQAMLPEAAKARKVIRVTCEGAALIPLDDFENFQGTLKELSVADYGKLKALIIKHGFSFPVQVWRRPDEARKIIDGHQRTFTVRKMMEEGWALPGGRLPADWILAATEVEAREKVLAAVSQFGKISDEGLYEFVETGGLDWKALRDDMDFPNLDMVKFEESFYKDLPPGTDGEPPAEPEKLASRYVVPPFSILDARQGYWKERKQAWLALGIKSDLGRGANLLAFSDTALQPDEDKRNAHLNEKAQKALGFYQAYNTDVLFGNRGYTGTSIFDPVLCEIAYRWFVPTPQIGERVDEDGKPDPCSVLDPFAGGSVRGILAAKLGLQYDGIELNENQISANREQADEILRPDEKSRLPEWIHGDSRKLKDMELREGYDFLFSCPPYGDLEIYSEDPLDLSTMTHGDFIMAYEEIIQLSCNRLKENRFAMFVVGDYRDTKSGLYHNFVSQTIRAFHLAGLGLYNHMILVTPLGTLPVRVVKGFEKARKVGKTHQDVLVFYKGDPTKIPEEFPPIAAESIEEIIARFAEEDEMKEVLPDQPGDAPPSADAPALAGEEPELPKI